MFQVRKFGADCDSVQRLQGLQKGFNLDFLDNKIAEEQEKQKQDKQQKSGSPAKRTPSNATRTTSGRTDSPSKRPSSRLRVPEGKDGSPAKAPDPDDFVIGDDESVNSLSRIPTPQPISKDGEGDERKDGGKQDEGQAEAGDKGKEKARDADELPQEVQVKLRKLDALTAKYQGMLTSRAPSLHRDWHLLFYSQNSTCIDLLRNYRTAHQRVAAIEPFEATLREHTSLTSIDDPGALIEFLHQRKQQTDMTMAELRRVFDKHQQTMKERDELKIKLQKAEQDAKIAFDEAAGLRQERNELEAEPQKSVSTSEVKQAPTEAATSSAKDEGDFFSYEDEVSKAAEEGAATATKAKAEETTSSASEDTALVHEAKVKELETEVETLKVEVKEQKDYINELATENANMRHEFLIAQTDLDAANKKLTKQDRDFAELQSELRNAREQLGEAIAAQDAARKESDEAAASLVQSESQLADLQARYSRSQEELKKEAAAAHENLKKHQDEHAKNLKDGVYAQRDEKVIDNLRNLVKTLQAQAKAATEAMDRAKGEVKDWKLECNRLESESQQPRDAIVMLRSKEADLAKLEERLEVAHKEREDMVRAKEATVNRLEKELGIAQEERDAAIRKAESKNGHEKAVASLRSQLKRAEQEREKAYQMILDCGRCGQIEKNTGTPSEDTNSTPVRSRMGSESTEVSTLPTEAGSETATPATPSVDGGETAGSADAKKKKTKKKSKAKKKETTTAASPAPSESIRDELTLDELIGDPTKAPDVLLRSKFGENPLIPLFKDVVENLRERNDSSNAQHDELLQHHESKIEELEQQLRNNSIILQAKHEETLALQQSLADKKTSAGTTVEQEAQLDSLKKEVEALKEEIIEKDGKIKKLQESLKSQATLEEKIEELTEEKDGLQESMVEVGKAGTDAKHELKEMKERRDKLQQEYDELQLESDSARKAQKHAEASVQVLTTRSKELEAELSELKTKSVPSTELDGLREQVQNLEREKEALQVSKETCEKQIEEFKAQQTASGAALDAKEKSLTTDLDRLRSKSSELEKELAQANTLAQDRFRSLAEVKELYTKAQAEVKKLREELAGLKTAKAELDKSNAIVKKLEMKEKDLRSEIAEYKSRAADKESEIASLSDKAKKATDRSTALEESYENARKELEKSESIRNEVTEAREKLQADLKKLQDELSKAKAKADNLEQEARKAAEEATRLKDELQFTSAQRESSQSMMDTMQDQTREMSTRMKEVEQRNESLEEELADAQRLLSERSREGETMRRLLSEVEARADSRVKEMREQMELAVSERDRAEDNASNIGRRKAREIEDLKSKLRDAEQEASRAKEAREDAEKRERDFKTQQADIEARAARAQQELNETRTAMEQLRDSLDETERSNRELENQRQSLRKEIADREARLEKLQKSSKQLTEELKKSQARQATGSSRSSMESSAARGSSRVTSPAPVSIRTSSLNGAPMSPAGSSMSTEHIKGALLSFFSIKEKKHQVDFVSGPMGKMLGLNDQDRQQLIAAIQAK
ncbi:uncharacterized protein MYCFIDRAFT_180596 [Pseudocercospora fijiensis CIRAD86]|uniref:GRIP domain-containing protein n=1 Tax=Pseudocercospora fijiensis (strain CIRAD86) TaxID=383855 RepID=M2ZXV1_PSEFD|nr:uncharacterized protein MYCFIDRAFT_180596 [Pseudocercospora fijiensis CIRAD86]EME76946.1 hypothetical protein MYCFIDRAFT_180596 [Pseudocercospora fijiensis CIRAD86]